VGAALSPMTWRERAALSMMALAGNLQQSRHLSPRDRARAWGLFAALLARFVDSRHAGKTEAVA
jgi:hypothetical protein